MSRLKQALRHHRADPFNNAGLMRKHVTHNRCRVTFTDFSGAILTFLGEEVTRKWRL